MVGNCGQWWEMVGNSGNGGECWARVGNCGRWWGWWVMVGICGKYLEIVGNGGKLCEMVEMGYNGGKWCAMVGNCFDLVSLLFALPVPMLRQVYLDLNPLHRHRICSLFHENSFF